MKSTLKSLSFSTHLRARVHARTCWVPGLALSQAHPKPGTLQILQVALKPSRPHLREFRPEGQKQLRARPCPS